MGYGPTPPLYTAGPKFPAALGLGMLMTEVGNTLELGVLVSGDPGKSYIGQRTLNYRFLTDWREVAQDREVGN